MTDCVFCKIASGEIPATKIFEDDKVVAFLDIRPVNKGHALVVPKNHSADLLDSDDETLKDTITRTKRIAKAVVKATGAAGFNLQINTGAAAGQVVFHLHLHIIPRYSNDGLKMWPHSESEPKTRDQVAEEIKKFL